jgi:hypothetical protein
MSAASARQRYASHLEDQRQSKLRIEAQRKRKHILDEIDAIKKKKKRLEDEVAELFKSSAKYADKAEATGNMIHLTKSNSLRKTAKEKKKALHTTVNELEDKVQALKD